MKKLAIIGAGSTMFTRQILSSLYCHQDLADLRVSLQDIDRQAMERSLAIARKMLSQEGLPTDLVSGTMEQKRALEGADFVINTIQVGGLEPWTLDVAIPKKYGVDQEVGDTLGPGGVFRALRHIPPTLQILDDMEEVCPQALFINYANPLAPLVWAASQYSRIRTVGLCYGVTYTLAQLAGYLGLGPWVKHPYTPEDWADLMYARVPANIEARYGGINHMTWILQLLVDGKDRTADIAAAVNDPGVYEADGVRCEIYRHFGYWSTENHWHFTDYVPYFRKHEDLINRFLPRRWNLQKLSRQVHETDARILSRQLQGEIPIRVEENILNAPKIIRALCTGQPVQINGNLVNRGLIGNLPDNCVVEVPIRVDREGLHPVNVGDLPPQCAALNRSNISVHELIVKAALEEDPQAAFHALCLDPLTAAVCTLDEIRRMFDEMYTAQRQWLRG